MRAILPAVLWAAAMLSASDLPQFNDKGELLFPANYREWVYLSSGIGMTYGPNAAQAMENPLFDTVFVNPSAFAAFKETGKWPEGATFVLEIRYATSQGSINKGGFYQTDIAAIEVEVKDSKRFPKGWAYFDFSGGMRPMKTTAQAMPENASCYGCHRPNGAVESTFVQFYPDALAIAEKKGTVKATYKPPVASPARMYHTIRETRTPVDQLLATAKAQDSAASVLKESVLNAMGYQLLQAGDQAQAIAVFRWTVANYPNSANAHDSLAEAYEKSGQKAAARESTQRALALLKSDTSVAEPRRERLQKAIEERLARLNQ
jgi:tetratricopeptide (TPR) repeat protein